MLFALSFVPMMSLVARDEAADGPEVEAPALGEANVDEPELETVEPPCDPDASPACERDDVPTDPAVVAYGSSS